MADRCKHNKMWVIAGGYWYWCYECGALRQGQQSETVNGTFGPWIKPVAKGGENPYGKLIPREEIKDINVS